MIGSPEINKVIRRVLSPLLRHHGFSAVHTRKNWGWHGPCTWVLELRAVGSYFSRCTGWPPMSLGVSPGVYYDFLPVEVWFGPIKVSPQGKPMPREWECACRSELHCTLDQRRLKQRLESRLERSRTDIWWIEPDGSNVEEVIQGIGRQFLAEGLAWFQRKTDLPTAYRDLLLEHDCYIKFFYATFWAKYLGYQNDYEEYRRRLVEEAERIERRADLNQLPEFSEAV